MEITQNWRTLRRDFLVDVECGFYIDKTDSLARMCSQGKYTHRNPRGFGKTTFLVTIGCFFGISLDEVNSPTRKYGHEFLNSLFGEEIAERFEITRYKNISPFFGSFIPIYFAFPYVCKNYFQHIVEKINDLILEFNLDSRYDHLFVRDKITDQDFNTIAQNLKHLCCCVYDQYSNKVIVLVDNSEQPYYTKMKYPNQFTDDEDFIQVFSQLAKAWGVYNVIFASGEEYHPKKSSNTCIC